MAVKRKGVERIRGSGKKKTYADGEKTGEMRRKSAADKKKKEIGLPFSSCRRVETGTLTTISLSESSTRGSFLGKVGIGKEAIK